MYNRRYYEEIVRGMKGPIGVALMDLDDFKVYNDTYGHHAGDMALKTAATIVRGCIRQTDALVRFGGDEFLLILPGIPEDYFKIKLEQIREKLHDAIVPGYSHMRLSTSIGGLIQMPSDSMDAVVRQADRLMYQPRSGRTASSSPARCSRRMRRAAGRKSRRSSSWTIPR